MFAVCLWRTGRRTLLNQSMRSGEQTCMILAYSHFNVSFVSRGSRKDSSLRKVIGVGIYASFRVKSYICRLSILLVSLIVNGSNLDSYLAWIKWIEMPEISSNFWDAAKIVIASSSSSSSLSSAAAAVTVCSSVVVVAVVVSAGSIMTILLMMVVLLMEVIIVRRWTQCLKIGHYTPRLHHDLITNIHHLFTAKQSSALKTCLLYTSPSPRD